ncbi:MAG: TlyA family RNA methyltransferase [Chloroflexi bacterium]|nr:MAG: TlyA family RNA methyltransferase [Chloroflexota bacterium]
MAKRRLDALLVDRGLAPDRQKAQALVMAGAVSVDERPAQKAGTLVDENAPLRLAERPRYVGRGGEKLEHALEAFGLDVRGLVVADIGASTGGFTDCLLQRGAERVYAIDSGKGQLDFRLRTDPRVAVMEGVNARTLESLPERVDLITIDVSFISLRLVLPAVRRLTKGPIVALFKPQFEARKSEVPRGGVIRDVQLHAQLIGRFVAWCVKNDFRVVDMTLSPIAGADGNREFFFWLRQAKSLPRGAGSLPHDGRSARRSRSRSGR